ncbi:MAG TPA: hypothetical protein VFB13_01955 [Reyranella sp.]|jgi:hypothetical protein|nr:hypothetical protein [Reyranella sp.]
MDSTHIIDQITAPWAGTLLGSVVIALLLAVGVLAIMLYRSWNAHLAEVRACSAEKMDMIRALDGFKEVMKAALEALKK